MNGRLGPGPVVAMTGSALAGCGGAKHSCRATTEPVKVTLHGTVPGMSAAPNRLDRSAGSGNLTIRTS